MALKMCSISWLVLNAVRLGLLVAWLGLTGMKVAHFLSEPTALQSRVDHKVELPYITVFAGMNSPSPSKKKKYPSLSSSWASRFGRQVDWKPHHTLLELVRSQSMSLAELSGETGLLSEEQRKRHPNKTTLRNQYGNWSETITPYLMMGATLTPSEFKVVLRLPRHIRSRWPQASRLAKNALPLSFPQQSLLCEV